MPHNRYFYNELMQEKATIIIEGDEFKHMTCVLRKREGDLIELINGKGQLAEGTLQAVEKKRAHVTIDKIEQAPQPSTTLTLYLAHLKQSHLEYACEKATELGVTEIVLFCAAKSEKKDISPTCYERLSHIIVSACKQCGRLYFPKLTVKKELKECLKTGIEAYFGSIEPTSPHLLLCHKDIYERQHAAIFIGPEAGFTREETELLEKNCKGVSLHHNILRAETAAITSVALLSALLTRNLQTCDLGLNPPFYH